MPRRATRKQSDDGLWSSPERFALILDGIADGVTAQDAAGHLIYANRAAAKLSGYATPDAMLAAPPADFVRKFEVLDEAGQPFPLDRLPGRRALRGEEAPETTLRYRNRASGEEHWSIVRSRPVLDAEGRVRLAITIFRDVTATVVQQRALEETAAELEIAVSDLGARTEEAERARGRMTAVLESITDGFMAFDPDWRIRYANGRALESLVALGKPKEAVLGRILWEAFPDLLGTPFHSHGMRAMTERTPVEFEEYYAPLDQWLAVRLYPSSEGLSSFSRDVTARRRAEFERERLLSALAGQRTRLEEILEQLPVGVLIAEAPSGRVLLGNREMEAIVRHPFRSDDDMARFVAEHGLFRIGGARYDRSEFPVYRALATGESVIEELSVERGDGTRAILRISAAPIREPEGTIVAAVSTFYDITAQKYSQLALIESEERYRRLVELSPEGIAIHAEGKVVFINESGARILGAERAGEIVGRPLMDFVHPDSRALVRDRLRALATGGTRLPLIEERFLRVDGTPIDVEVASMPFVHEGKPAGQVVVRDVTERKRTERTLRVLAEAGKVLAASLDYETSLRSLTGLLVPEFADWCFVDLAEPQGGFRRLAVAYADPDGGSVARRLEREYAPKPEANVGVSKVIATGESQLLSEMSEETMRTIARDDDHLATLHALGLYSTMIVPLIARGKTLGTLSLIRSTPAGGRYTAEDVAFAEELGRRAALAADNARLYKEAVEANEAKSDFLAVMSHELRTPLAAIIGYAEILGDEIVGPVNEAQKEQLARVRASGAHLLTLIEEILAFARIEAGQETVHLEAADLNVLVRDTLALVEPIAARKQIELRLRLPADPLTTETDVVKMRQILLNLLANAIKFTDEGSVTVELRGEGARVTLAVEDTGIGISPEHVESIFDPFWQVEQARTRKVGGTGLGLSVARQFARLLGGDVTVTSEVGKGSRFACTIPWK